MKETLSILLLSAALMMSACAGPSGPEQSTSTGYQASQGAISVVEFSLAGATVTYNAPHDTFGLAVAEQIASELRKLGHSADAVPTGADPVGPVIVTGRIVRIDAGSRAARYFVGFGAGAAKFAVAGSVRQADGSGPADFSDERWSGFGVFGGSAVSLVQKCLRAVGSDVAKMIHTGEYKLVKEGD